MGTARFCNRPRAAGGRHRAHSPRALSGRSGVEPRRPVASDNRAPQVSVTWNKMRKSRVELASLRRVLSLFKDD